MKKIFYLMIFVFCASLAVYIFYRGEETRFIIEEGQAASKIAENLKKEGIIWSSLYFKALVRLNNASKKIMPGEYNLRRKSSHEEVLWKITHSVYISAVKVVIPEGWRAEQIAERLKIREVIKSEKEFLDLVVQRRLEGYLFPSTYHMKKNMSAEDALSMMLLEYEKNIKPLIENAKLSKNIDEKKVMIIASIVEREAVIDTERPLIAAVYLNRIKRNMPLEADPTVQYALGYWKKNLTYKDLKFPSPYNTYYVSSIPPGPICNPGVKSVAAVLEPADIDALYFVADRQGKHIFNNKFEEHKKAIKRIKQLNPDR